MILTEFGKLFSFTDSNSFDLQVRFPSLFLHFSVTQKILGWFWMESLHESIINADVSQGSIRGTGLLILFINILHVICNIADDTTLYFKHDEASNF